MTRFVYNTATSVNGHLADASNSLAWLVEVDGADPGMNDEFLRGVGVQVMGSTTYRWLLDAEDLLESPHRWQEFFGSMPTIVFSTRRLPIPSGADVEVCSGPVAQHLDRITQRAADRDVWIVGGGDLAGQFLDAGRLDRIELAIAPVLLEGGAPLLPRYLPSARLSLVEVERIGPFVRVVYDVHPAEVDGGLA